MISYIVSKQTQQFVMFTQGILFKHKNKMVTIVEV